MSKNKSQIEFLPHFSLGKNPFTDDFVEQSAVPKTVEEPILKSISAGKNTYVYDAHTYHTKVPPQGIKDLIEHFTNKGDVVLDPFCGSGMTGIAAQMCGRKVILSDLSPAATFIAYNLNSPISFDRYENAVNQLLEKASELEQQLYGTPCRHCGQMASASYLVWSYGVKCPICSEEFVLWHHAQDLHDDPKKSKIKSEIQCPSCQALVEKRKLKRTNLNPVEVGYRCACVGGLEISKAEPNSFDIAKLTFQKKEDLPENLWYPKGSFPLGVNTKQPIHAGITSVDKAYTKRGLWAMAWLWNEALKHPDEEIKLKLLFTITSLYKRVTLFSEHRFWGGSGNTAHLNVPMIIKELNVFRAFRRKAQTIKLYFQSTKIKGNHLRVTTQSATNLSQIPDHSIDYIFTDPPFGANINYSEMNFIWESWLGALTDTKHEAIVNKFQGKGIAEYSNLLAAAFQEARRVLKPGAWLSVMFHNSSGEVWEALQNALALAGFALKGTLVFDKKHGTFKQFVSDNAVGYDLVLHCQPANSNPIFNESELREKLAEDFLNRKLSIIDTYRVHYLHVERADEFDYRKLYSEFLAETLDKGKINLDFEKFRNIVNQTLSTLEYDRI